MDNKAIEMSADKISVIVKKTLLTFQQTYAGNYRSREMF